MITSAFGIILKVDYIFHFVIWRPKFDKRRQRIVFCGATLLYAAGNVFEMALSRAWLELRALVMMLEVRVCLRLPGDQVFQGLGPAHTHLIHVSNSKGAKGDKFRQLSSARSLTLPS